MKWVAAAFLAFIPMLASGDERLVTGVVYSCMADGIRHYTTKPLASCQDRREIKYSHIERTLRPGERALYSCRGADGIPTYTSNAGPGCRFITTYFERPQAWSRAQPPRAAMSAYWYSCTSDCSGHNAGYEWAARRGLTDRYQCSGNSQSFIEGCWAYVEEHEE